MKKIFALLFAAASMMTAVSCNRAFDEKEVPSDGTIYITRTYEAGFEASSKTFADASGKVNWEQGDVIRYYSVNNGTVGEVVLPEGGARAQLPLEVAVDASYLVCVHGGFSISNPSADGLTIVGALNNVQSGVFGENHVALVKTSGVNSPTLTFHNIVSYYKFTFIIDDVKSVVFKSNDGTQLHGYGNINVVFDGDEATASLGSGGESKITVNNGGRGTFYIAALPGTLQDGFTIDCYDSSHSLIGSVKTTKPVELKPNSILNLGVLDTRISQDYMDLSAPGTANSYIVSETGFYKFKTVKGNSSESVGSVASAEVLWETFGTDVAPVEGELVDGVYLDGDYINFRASDLKGNAVIAAKDASGTILWSWHIWLTDQPVDQVYNNGAGTLMDRNLGATSATPGDVHALGLLYQWGRKDPFLGGNAISSTTMASSTGTWPAAISIADITGDNSLSYALSNPMTFIFNNESVPFDWYSTDATLSNNELWSEDKSTYDPCPPGYSVPEGGADGVWARAAGTSTTTTVPLFETKISEENGIDFSSSSVGSYALGTSSVIWYPSTGSRLYSTGDLFSVGLGGSYWSCSHVGSQSNIFNFRENGYYAPADVSYRVIGRSVRCYKEGSSTFVPVTAISLNKTSTTIENGKTDQLTATITPSSANVKTVTWSTSNSAVATVAQDGLVSAKGAGTCTITATSYNGLKATCEITVTTPVTAISLNKTSASIERGKTLQLTATITPTNATNKTVTWSTSSATVATVSTAGLVTAKAVGTCTITATSNNGLKATCAVTVVAPGTDLSASGTANSYIVSAAGTYKIKTVKGNSTTSVGTVASASVLWESFGTSTKPAVGDLISGVKVEGNYITFTASAKKGNAVIAAKNSSGTILWSWHIWLTNKPADQVYNNNAGTMMDRNLGATSATPGAVQALGLFYQWGRKDPFLGSSSTTNAVKAQSTNTWPAVQSTSKSGIDMTYAQSHPTTFLTEVARYVSTAGYHESSWPQDDNRWSSTKTINDPCPPGYRVPNGGEQGVWAKALGTSSDIQGLSYWDSTNHGINFGTSPKKLGSSSTIWYPASGYLHYETGELVVGNGAIWSNTPETKQAREFWYVSSYNGHIYPATKSYRGNAFSVRCQKIQ